MKVVILTSAHPTDDVRVMSKIAGGLVERGHAVVWCGVRRSFFDDQLDPAVEWRLQPLRAGWRGRLQNLFHSARAAAAVRDADWIYTPDPDAAIAAVLAAKVSGARTVFDIHEDFHNGLLRRGIRNPQVAGIAGRLVKAVISGTAHGSDLTIGVSRGNVHTYTSDRDRRRVVLNTATRLFAGTSAAASRNGRPLVVMHGKAMTGNGSEKVMEALREPGLDDVKALFITSGRPGAAPFDAAINAELAQPPLDARVERVAGVPHREMPVLLGACAVGLISYDRVLGEASLPNRLFEYMAAGLAVLAPSYSPDIVRILEAHHCGITADFEDPADIASKLRHLASHPEEVAAMGEAGRVAFLEHFAWEAQLDGLVATLEGTE